MRDFYDLRSQLVVQTLDLSHNQIRRVAASAVPDSASFVSLNVNQIKEIEDGAFADKLHLRKLDLYANQLVHLKKSQLRLSPLANPEIYLGGNPLSCDCHLQWLAAASGTAEAAGGNGLDIRDIDSIYCHRCARHIFLTY